jgi:DNA-binding HxlR family transcriptional regulator
VPAWVELWNLAGEDPERVHAEMRATASQNPRTRQPVYHLVLSPAPEDRLERRDWLALADRVLEELGLGEHQAVGARLVDGYWIHGGVSRLEPPRSRILDQVSHPTRYRGRRVRALRIGDAQDLALLQAISRGEFATSGLRNRDLRPLLCPTSKTLSPLEVRRLSAKVSRQLRMLRAHGILRKVPKSHRYRLTAKGHLLTAALFAARRASVKQLLACAA